MVAGLLLWSKDILPDKSNASNIEVVNKIDSNPPFEDLMIHECQYNNKLFYSVGAARLDVGSSIYNENGEMVVICGDISQRTEDICSNLTNCEPIYIPENNNFGYGPVNKYNLK